MNSSTFRAAVQHLHCDIAAQAVVHERADTTHYRRVGHLSGLSERIRVNPGRVGSGSLPLSHVSPRQIKFVSLNWWINRVQASSS